MKRFITLIGVTVLMSGCVAVPEGAGVAHDPWERVNRGMFRVNEAVDNVTLKPVAKAYNKVLPQPVRTGVTNFSRNLFAPMTALNHFLQGKPKSGFSQLSRFFINSTVGIGGLVDIAAMNGIEGQGEDFGQTAAVWGVPPGPYVVIPFLGPSTLRDAIFLRTTFAADPLFHYDNTSVRDKLYVLRVINVRARVLSLEELLQDSKDPYITLRESYLQNREFQIYDGDPPLDDDDEFYDEFLDEEDY